MNNYKPKQFILWILRFYKRHLSRGENCRMIPNCSEYAYEAVEKYGTIRGLRLGMARILKCHPWGKSGIDLLK